MEKKRLYYLDVIRMVSFVIIIWYHFLVESNILYDFMGRGLRFGNENFHLATLSVSLFFMISGAGLMLSEKDSFSIKEYYKKRVLRVLLPFYIVYLGVFLYRFYEVRSWPFVGDIPLWKFVYTLTGTDAYFSLTGTENFSLLIGEWFLGCLVIFYLVFPLVRIGVKKFPKIFFIGTTVYLMVVLLAAPFRYIEPHRNLLVKVYDFVLGMYLVRITDKIGKKEKRLLLLAAAIILLFPFPIPLPEAVMIVILAGSVFLLVSQGECYYQRCAWLEPLLLRVRKYSFEVFLLHHVVINYFTKKFAERGRALLLREVLVLFVLEMTIIFGFAWLVRRLEDAVEKILDESRRKRIPH